LRRITSTVLYAPRRPSLGSLACLSLSCLNLACLNLACATGSEDSNNMSGLSAGNQTESSSGGTDTSGNMSGSGSGSNSNGTTTAPTNSSDPTSETDPTNPTEDTDDTTEPGCIDGDGDGYGENCGLGSDCDDDDFNNYTDEGCANCIDLDADDVWTGCDQYDDVKPGPDCDDDNESVGLGDAVELCNGLAENCAGEIDPLPPEEMCPAEGDPPNVTSWACIPPEPGVDGCTINGCDDQWFDVNTLADDGCECQGTDRTKSLAGCGDAAPGALGSISEGGSAADLVVGAIPTVASGGDWYSVEFPQGTRPTSGIIKVSFAQNENEDYRFEAFRECGQEPWAGNLAKDFGAGAPPALEWWFQDTGPSNSNYSNTVTWPTKAYIRVFRTQNDNSCSKYQLKVERAND